MAESRVTTVVAEVLHTGGVPNARVSGLVAEVLHGLEALTTGDTGRKPIVVWSRGEHAGSWPPDRTQIAATRARQYAERALAPLAPSFSRSFLMLTSSQLRTDGAGGIWRGDTDP